MGCKKDSDTGANLKYPRPKGTYCLFSKGWYEYAMNIEAQIRDNIWRSYIWMAALTSIIAVLGSLVSYYFNWGLTGTSTFIVIAGVINILSYFFSDKLVLRG